VLGNTPTSKQTKVKKMKIQDRLRNGAAIVPDAGQWSEGTRIMLGAMREASREMCDGCYRDAIAELEKADLEEREEADLEEREEAENILREMRGGRVMRLTFSGEEEGVDQW